jgi:dipeptidyl aminopeptidase/acylaminoacyl peptidase
MRVQLTGLRLSLAAAAVAVVALISSACGGSGGQATPSPSPQNGSPVSGTPTATPQPPLEPTSYRFLYSEFGAEADIIWSIKPHDPTDKVQVASVPHKTGWAITPALSPDGKKIAYNAMPDDGLFPNADAVTYILDLASGKSELVAAGVDLLTTPRWSPDGGLLFLRRNLEEEVTIILLDLREPEENGEPAAGEDKPPPVRTVLRRHVSDVLSYIPLGFDAKSATMYFVQIQGGTESGSYLGRYGPATGEAVATATAIADATATVTAGTPSPVPSPNASPAPLPGDVFLVLSDQIARDYALSPDTGRVAFLVPGLVEGQIVSRTYVADIKSEVVSALQSPAGLAPGDQLSPAWHPDGKSVAIGQLPGGGEPGRVAVVPLDGGQPLFLPPPDKGFDQPLSWSPDGKFLAVTSFSGESLGNPGPSRLVFVSVNGQRPAAPEGAEIRAVGWLAAE